MRKTSVVLFAALLVSATVHPSLAADSPGAGAKPGSLVAKINQVTVLELVADRPVTGYRLLVNGKPEDEKRTYGGRSGHVYVAVVPSEKTARVHMKVGHSNCLLWAPFVMGPDKNIQDTIKYVYPEKKVSLDGWTTIYGVTIKELGAVVRSINVQIRGAELGNPVDKKAENSEGKATLPSVRPITTRPG